MAGIRSTIIDADTILRNIVVIRGGPTRVATNRSSERGPRFAKARSIRVNIESCGPSCNYGAQTRDMRDQV
jgi:hypothetical protein